MEMVEALEIALEDFDGTLLMVSHDRAFIEGLADRIWLIEDGVFYEYPGWEDYRAKHRTLAELEAEEQREAAQAEAKAAPRVTAPKGKGLWHLKREVEAIEADIARLETELEAAHAALSSAPRRRLHRAGPDRARPGTGPRTQDGRVGREGRGGRG